MLDTHLTLQQLQKFNRDSHRYGPEAGVSDHGVRDIEEEKNRAAISNHLHCVILISQV